MLGLDWVKLFIKRHNLTNWISDNIKAARAGVTRDVIKNYFNHLENSLQNSHFPQCYES